MHRRTRSSMPDELNKIAFTGKNKNNAINNENEVLNNQSNSYY